MLIDNTIDNSIDLPSKNDELLRHRSRSQETPLLRKISRQINTKKDEERYKILRYLWFFPNFTLATFSRPYASTPATIHFFFALVDAEVQRTEIERTSFPWWACSLFSSLATVPRLIQILTLASEPEKFRVVLRQWRDKSPWAVA